MLRTGLGVLILVSVFGASPAAAERTCSSADAASVMEWTTSEDLFLNGPAAGSNNDRPTTYGFLDIPAAEWHPWHEAPDGLEYELSPDGGLFAYVVPSPCGANLVGQSPATYVLDVDAGITFLVSTEAGEIEETWNGFVQLRADGQLEYHAWAEPQRPTSLEGPAAGIPITRHLFGFPESRFVVVSEGTTFRMVDALNGNRGGSHALIGEPIAAARSPTGDHFAIVTVVPNERELQVEIHALALDAFLVAETRVTDGTLATKREGVTWSADGLFVVADGRVVRFPDLALEDCQLLGKPSNLTRGIAANPYRQQIAVGDEKGITFLNIDDWTIGGFDWRGDRVEARADEPIAAQTWHVRKVPLQEASNEAREAAAAPVDFKGRAVPAPHGAGLLLFLAASALALRRRR